MREYVSLYGVRSVGRKKPLDNEKILAMLATPNGVSAHGLIVDWGSYFWVSTKAWISVLSESGERKAEIAKPTKASPIIKGRFTFASLVWKIRGTEYAFPALLLLLSIGNGDGVYLKHGTAKNDFFGSFFAATPSFLPFVLNAPRNACCALRELWIAALNLGLSATLAGSTPLFGPSLGEEFTCHEVDSTFLLLLEFGAGISAQELLYYSVHSFRIFVACALLSLGSVSREHIKRLLRWRGDESLLAYARLNDEEWTTYVVSSYTATVNSTIAARLAALGPIDLDVAAIGIVESSEETRNVDLNA